MDQLNNLSLSPEAMENLNASRDSQIQGLQLSADQLVGSAVADLSNRGMMSSSTAEGSMGSISAQLAPYLAQIESDYAQQLISLPQELSAQNADLANSAFSAGTTKTSIDQGLLDSILQAYMGNEEFNAQGAQNVYNAGTQSTGIDIDALNAIFNAGMTNAGVQSTAAQTQGTIRQDANKNTQNAAVDNLNLAGNLFNTKVNAGTTKLAPYQALYGTTTGAANADPMYATDDGSGDALISGIATILAS